MTASGSPVFESVYRSDGQLAVELEMARVHGPGGPHTHHRLTIGEGRPGVVVICRSTRGMLLTWSERVAAGERMAELPRGLVEPEDFDSEHPLVRAAERELREETGVTAADSRLLGMIVVDSAVYPLRVGVVLCSPAAAQPPFERDGEIDAMRWVTTEAMDRMVAGGEVTDAITLSALSLLRASENAMPAPSRMRGQRADRH